MRQGARLDCTAVRLRSAAAVVAALLMVACGQVDDEAPGPFAGDESGTAADAYTVRGQVVALPGPDDPRISIHHEAIDDLRGIDGTVWGMDAMTMSFAVSDDVSLEGIAEGDKVEFVLEVDWEAEPASWVSSIRELPPDTVLEYRSARPPTPEQE